MSTIILATAGTLGDLHPFVAIAHALKERGLAPVLAVAEDHVDKAARAGIEAAAVFESFAAVQRRLGLSEQDATQHLIGNQRTMLEQVLLPDLAASTRSLDRLAARTGAAAVVSSTFILGAPIVAEKRGLPFIAAVLQPMAMLSADDPPVTPDFRIMKGPPVGRVGAMWNRGIYAAARRLLDSRYGELLDAVRVEHGLPPRGAAGMFDPMEQAALTLGCYSPLFAPLPPDAPRTAVVTGFPVFDGAAAPLDPPLADFLDAGSPPVVFTLGSFVVGSAGRFYAEAAAAARRIGRRAVLLTGDGLPPRRDADTLRCHYAPHSLVFPRAAAIVHHGGVGTTGQALRAGKPQLVVPHMGDQYDNAARVARMGVGRVIAASRFRAAGVAARLDDLLGDRARVARAREVGDVLRGEHGARAAVRAIAAILPATPPA